MQIVDQKCCGLDVHQAKVVACLLVSEANSKPRKVIRQFGTSRATLRSSRAGCLARSAHTLRWKGTRPSCFGHRSHL